MQKILIIHSNEGDLTQIAQGIAEGAGKKGHQVDVVNAKDSGRPITFFSYDLVIAGSPTRGFFRGQIAEDIRPFFQQCKRTAGKQVIAFVTPRAFATTKALKMLMGELEKLGCFVKNFISLSSKQEAIKFGEKL